MPTRRRESTRREAGDSQREIARGDQRTNSLHIGAGRPILDERRHVLTHQPVHLRGTVSRSPGNELERLRRTERLDREHELQPLGRLEREERRGHPHAHVILLIVRGRHRVQAHRVSKRPQLGKQCCRRVLDHHVAARAPGIGREKGREPEVERRRQEPERATLGDRAKIGERNPQRVECQRQALPVKVSGGDDSRRLIEHERVVGRGVQVDLDESSEKREPFPRGAVYLRRAAERVGVLEVALPRPDPLRTCRQGSNDRGGALLPGHGTQGLDVGIEGAGLAPYRLERKRGNPVRAIGEPRAANRENRADRSHEMRAVDERERLLRGELERLDVGLAKSVGGRPDMAGRVEHLALADQRKKCVSGGSEIAARPE